MALAFGTKLNEYEIVAPIGAGGMGEVYQARDTKLDREVAIKVLPDGLADDRERLARFEREAKLLASLNHDNIATLYGLGESGSVRFLAMELVEGETLEERLARGPLELEEALPIFRQIAVALEAAHDKGVIHRDLKPANVKITEDGKVKVLDFGLAKALVPEPSEEDLSQSPTRLRQGYGGASRMSGTMAGVIMGTAPYMSPEQARGKKVDQRTDVWAFGCVLFEALTGEKPFAGATVTDTLAAVVRAEPEWSELPETTPASIRRLLRRALIKDRTGRLPHIGAARLEIDDVGEEAAVALTGTAPRSLKPVLAALLTGAIVAGLTVWAFNRPAVPPVVRLAISDAGDEPFSFFGNPPTIAISPDGQRVIYRTGTDVRQLNVRDVGEFEAVPLADGTNPFVSPDGEWVGFVDAGVLKKVPIGGGPAIVICPIVGFPRGASWGPDDRIVFASRGAAGLHRVSASGGEPETLTFPDRDRGETNHRWPEVLPDGRAVVFEIERAGSIESSSLAVLSLDTGEVTELVTGGSFPRYAASGHLVYAGLNGLWAVGFDTRRFELTTAPVHVLEGVLTTSANAAHYSVAQDGTLVYVKGDLGVADRTLVWVDRLGREVPIGVERRPYVSAALSPDGNRVVSEIQDSNVDIWISDLVRRTSSRLTFDAEADTRPIWTHDGERIVFTSGGNLFWQPADGTGEPEELGEGTAPWFALPGGEGVLATRRGGETLGDIVLVSPEGSKPVIEERYEQTHASLSPDGRWIAYSSNESGRYEIYVRPFPDVSSGKWPISTGGGSHPVWSRNGRELFYLSVGEMMAVAVETEPEFSAASPTLLFAGAYVQNSRRVYDVAPDGDRFLMIKGSSAAETTDEILVVLNWFQELERLVPVQ